MSERERERATNTEGAAEEEEEKNRERDAVTGCLKEGLHWFHPNPLSAPPLTGVLEGKEIESCMTSTDP